MVGVMGGSGSGSGGGAASSGGTGAVAAAAGGGGAGQQPVAKSMAAFRSLELCDRLKLEIENITSEIR